MEIAHFITEARHIKDYQVLVTFGTGERKIVDLESRLEKKFFHPLKNPDLFKQVFVDPVTRTLTWPGGADFCPDFLFLIGQPVQVKGVGLKPSK